MFDSIFGVVKDVATVALAPVEIAADLARAVTKPIAEGTREVTKEVKELVSD